MTRLEALEQAASIVKELEETPKNDRGYPKDGWRAPTFAERTQAVLTVAEFLLGIESEEE